MIVPYQRIDDRKGQFTITLRSTHTTPPHLFITDQLQLMNGLFDALLDSRHGDLVAGVGLARHLNLGGRLGLQVPQPLAAAAQDEPVVLLRDRDALRGLGRGGEDDDEIVDVPETVASLV